MRLVYISAVFWFLLDQGSKWGVVHGLNLETVRVIEVFPPYLTFIMGWNTGINFGLFAEAHEASRWFLIVLALGISAWVFWWARSLERPIALLSAGAIVGGALGNALDRVIYGAVADFLNMSCCGIQNPFTFNIADIGIFAGAFGLILFADTKKITP